MTLDLSLGHPLYLERYWRDLSINWDEGNVFIQAHANMAYGLYEGEAGLKKAITEVHHAIGNAETKDRHILIGNGATQVLHAVLANSPYSGVYARRPYFFRFPNMFHANGLIEHDQPPEHEHFTELITTPSNPDFKRYPETNSRFKIHDLCYNWPQYGPVVKHDDDVMVFSYGKATGHAGSKIGWALIKDKGLYDKAVEYIENSTGGVSRDSQMRAKAILENQHDRFLMTVHPLSCFEIGRQILEMRWSAITGINIPGLKVLNNSGMFLWIELDGSQDAAADILAKYDIKGRDGRACGGNPNQVRFNVGCSDRDFQIFINRLK